MRAAIKNLVEYIVSPPTKVGRNNYAQNWKTSIRVGTHTLRELNLEFCRHVRCFERVGRVFVR